MSGARVVLILAFLMSIAVVVVFCLPSSREVVEEGRPTQTEKHLPNEVPRTRDSALTNLVNREADGHDRVTADITSRIPEIKRKEDISAVVAVLHDTNDDDTVRNEAANLLRRSGYSSLTDDLIKVLSNAQEKERFRSFCVQHLYSNYEGADTGEKETISKSLHTYLTDRHVKVRREALLALHRLKDPVAGERALKWLHDEQADDVRDLAIRIARELDIKDELPTIRKLARDPNIVTARAAIVTLAHWGDKESRPAMEEAAKSSNVLLQRAGKAALKRLDSQ